MEVSHGVAHSLLHKLFHFGMSLLLQALDEFLLAFETQFKNFLLGEAFCDSIKQKLVTL